MFVQQANDCFGRNRRRDADFGQMATRAVANTADVVHAVASRDYDAIVNKTRKLSQEQQSVVVTTVNTMAQ